MSKTPKQQPKVFRTSIELPQELWDELQTALARRAAKLTLKHGVEVKPTFTAWLKHVASETVNTYK